MICTCGSPAFTTYDGMCEDCWSQSLTGTYQRVLPQIPRVGTSKRMIRVQGVTYMDLAITPHRVEREVKFKGGYMKSDTTRKPMKFEEIP